nr:ribonuclease P protein component [Corynebacterium aquatimens]
MPQPNKLSSSADFRTVMKKGSSAGSRTVVVHYYEDRAVDPPVISGGPRCGLVVSKQVGNAVTRHAVSRKLRHVFASLTDVPVEARVVIRALPASATATSQELSADVAASMARARAKAARQ